MGRLPVLISITDPEWAKYQVIAGASGQAAIYTKHFHHVSVMRKVLLRMASWMNYVFPSTKRRRHRQRAGTMPARCFGAKIL